MTERKVRDVEHWVHRIYRVHAELEFLVARGRLLSLRDENFPYCGFEELKVGATHVRDGMDEVSSWCAMTRKAMRVRDGERGDK